MPMGISGLSGFQSFGGLWKSGGAFTGNMFQNMAQERMQGNRSGQDDRWQHDDCRQGDSHWGDENNSQSESSSGSIPSSDSPSGSTSEPEALADLISKLKSLLESMSGSSPSPSPAPESNSSSGPVSPSPSSPSDPVSPSSNSISGSNSTPNSDTTPGAAVSGEVGANLQQQQIGDCVGISALKSFSTTPEGESILKSSVSKNADGSYDVRFKGDPGQVYNIKAQDLSQYAKGDPAASAILAATYQHFGIDPQTGSLPTDKMMELLAGNQGSHQKWVSDSASQVENELKQLAPHIGKDTAVVFGGAPGSDGQLVRGNDHAFCLTGVNEANQTISYTDPWNDNQQHTMSINDFINDTVGTGADIEEETLS